MSFTQVSFNLDQSLQTHSSIHLSTSQQRVQWLDRPVYSGLSCINLDDPNCLKWKVCQNWWSWHPSASKYHNIHLGASSKVKLTINCNQLQAPNEAASIKMIVSLSSHLRVYQAVFAYILTSHKFQTFLDLFWICKPFLRLNKAN